MKKLLLIVSIALIFANCGSKGVAVKQNDKGQRIIRIALNVQESSPHAITLKEILKSFNEKTNNAYEIQYFFDGQLGEQQQIIELLRANGIELGWINSSVLGTYVSLYDAFNLPYVLNSDEHAAKATASLEVNQILTEASRLQNFVPAILFDNGARSFHGRKPYLKPEDLKGEKIRIMQSPIYVEILKLLGANPVPLAFTEQYSALQQGVIDGIESGPGLLLQYFDVIDHFSYTMTTRPLDTLISSTSFWDSLSEEHKKAFIEARTDKLLNFHSENYNKEQKRGIDKALANGVKFHDNVDIEAFKKVLLPMQEEWAAKKPEHRALLDIIRKLE